MAEVDDKRVDSEEEESDDDELPPDFFEVKVVKNRGSVSAEAYGDWNKKVAFVPPVIPKSDEQRQRLGECLSKSFLFSGLEVKEMAAVIGAMNEVKVEPKSRLIKQGDDGDCLYVVETGVFACSIRMPDGSEMVVKHCEKNDVFGELALLYNCPRAASVESTQESIVWRLDRDTFNNIVKDSAQQKRTRQEEFLWKVPLLQEMNTADRAQVAECLREEMFQDGQSLVQQGDVGNKFYILEEGQAVAVKNGTEVMSYSAGDYFGELALLRNQPREATVTAKGDVKVLSMAGSSFKRLINADKLEEWAKKYE